MTDSHEVFSTGELTPERLRTATFPTSADGYDPVQVKEFLEQTASALEVLAGEAGPSAVRAELQRISDSTSRIILAAQDTAEKLREQGASDARQVVEDAKQLAHNVAQQAEQSSTAARAQIDQARASFIDELRDLYDRIGATLYRFEQSAKEASATPPAVPVGQTTAMPAETESAAPAAEPASSDELVAEVVSPPAADVAEPAVADDEPTAPPSAEGDGAPAESVPVESAPTEPVADDPLGSSSVWGAAPSSDATPADDEPLVDLRGLSETVDATSVNEPAAEKTDADDDARAEHILAMTRSINEVGPHAGVVAEAAAEAEVQASYTEDSLRQFVLQSLHEGSPREAIEVYLRDTLQVADPAGLVDRALADTGAGS